MTDGLSRQARRTLIGGIVVAAILGFFELATRASVVVLIANVLVVVFAIVVTVSGIRNATRLQVAHSRSRSTAVWGGVLALVAVALGVLGAAVLLNGFAQGIVAIVIAVAFIAVGAANVVAATRLRS